MKKYELTDETKLVNGKTVYRIKALKSFNDVKEGELGGFVESYSNLSQYDNCWIYNDAVAMDNSVVTHNARIRDNAIICDKASINDNSSVIEQAIISGCVNILDRSLIAGSSKIFGNCMIVNDSYITGNVECCGYVSGHSILKDNVKIAHGANVINAELGGNAVIRSIEDYLVIRNNFSSGRRITWTKSNNMFKTGCFYGTGEELIAKAYKDSKRKGDKFKMIVEFVEKFNS